MITQKKAFESELTCKIETINISALSSHFMTIMVHGRLWRNYIKEEQRLITIGGKQFYPGSFEWNCVRCIKLFRQSIKVECHPFFSRKDATKGDEKNMVLQPEAWGPFAEGKNKVQN